MKSFALAALLACAACAPPTAWTHGVPNLHEVQPGVYRGGQPTADGWAYLRGLGVRHVLKLNFDSEGDDRGAVAFGLTVHQVAIYPAAFLSTFDGPTPMQVRQIVSVLLDQKLRPLYIHCTHGHDRTGLAVGLLRLETGWTKPTAYREMRMLGFHPELLGLVRAWEEYQPRRRP